MFNYATHVAKNIPFLHKIYGKYFKTIIWYSDIPIHGIVEVPDVNYVYINQGHLTHAAFPLFNDKYQDLIKSSDGIFYIMDDCIINPQLLDTIDVNFPIFASHFDEGPLGINKSEWWWWTAYKDQLRTLVDSGSHPDFFVGGFSDYFYIPKELWTDNLISKFKLFTEYNIFLEIAIPTIFHSICKSVDHKTSILWGNDRTQVHTPGWIERQFNDGVFILHPVKLGENQNLLNFMTPDAKYDAIP